MELIALNAGYGLGIIPKPLSHMVLIRQLARAEEAVNQLLAEVKI